ncbi:MAG: hypothetical protein KKG84_03020, partial [Candidatus Omnitrophica bacterium]|nr:hypothetical protein [Candidatus Omnitrophota bacterium]
MLEKKRILLSWKRHFLIFLYLSEEVFTIYVCKKPVAVWNKDHFTNDHLKSGFIKSVIGRISAALTRNRRKDMARILKCSLIMLMIASAAVLGGCSSAPIKTGPAVSETEDDRDRQIEDLQDEIDRLNEENLEASKELKKLEDAKKALESKLSKEIGEYKAKLEMTSRGLVITFLNEILFDPGKDEIKEDGQKTLKDVSKVLNTEVSGSEIAVEGHTDTQPIKYSGW